MNELCSIMEIPAGPRMRCCEVEYEGSLMMLLPYYIEGAVVHLTASEVRALHAASDYDEIKELNKYL